MRKTLENELMEKGVSFLREGNTLAGLACFEKLHPNAKIPELQSCRAFCIAVERGQINEAMAICEDAIEQDPENPVHYLNMGRIFLRVNKKAEAIDVLRKGLSMGDNVDIHQLLEKIGVRRKPVFPFLQRKHFLNKYCGLILYRMKIR